MLHSLVTWRGTQNAIHVFFLVPVAVRVLLVNLWQVVRVVLILSIRGLQLRGLMRGVLKVLGHSGGVLIVLDSIVRVKFRDVIDFVVALRGALALVPLQYQLIRDETLVSSAEELIEDLRVFRAPQVGVEVHDIKYVFQAFIS